MSLLGNPKTIEYTLSEEEEINTSVTDVRRRNVEYQTIRQEFDGGAAFTTSQQTPPSGYRLRNVTSKLREPDFQFGEHQENFVKAGAWTTTTTTT